MKLHEGELTSFFPVADKLPTLRFLSARAQGRGTPRQSLESGRSDPFLTEQHECRRRLADLDRQHTVKSHHGNPDRG